MEVFRNGTPHFGTDLKKKENSVNGRVTVSQGLPSTFP